MEEIVMEELYITKKGVVEAVCHFIQPLMSANGFTFVKSLDSFVKKDKDVSFEVNIGVKNFWPLKQEINIPVVVVSNTINNVLKKFFKDTKKSDLTCHKWLILPNSNPLGYKELYNQSDIITARKEVLEIIEKDGLLFLEKYSQLQNIAEYYMEFFRRSRHLENFSVLLIALKLSNDQRFESIKNEILGFINEVNFNPNQNSINEHETFFQLMEYLDKLS